MNELVSLSTDVVSLLPAAAEEVEAHESLGFNIFLHVSYLLIFISFTLRDILWLRTMSIISSVVWICAMFLYNHIIDAALFWNSLFIAINIYQVSAIIHQNRSATFSDEEKDLYQTIFQNLKPGELMRIFAAAEWHDAEPGRILLEEGKPGTGVKLITRGRVSVVIDDKEVTTLGEGTFIGEMSYLSGDPAAATVEVREPMRFLEWNNEKLTKTLDRNPALKYAFHSILTSDLAKKLKS